MSTLQITLWIVGALIVAGVLFYNAISYRRIRRRYLSKITPPPAKTVAPAPEKPKSVEPTLAAVAPALPTPPLISEGPDYMAETVLTLEVGEHRNVTSDLAQKMLDAPGKKVRILWQTREKETWIPLTEVATICAYLNEITPAPAKKDSQAKEEETPENTPTARALAFCLQLADRSNVTTIEQLEAFQKHIHSIAKTLSATYTPFDPIVEADRAHALDKVCAQLDIQIALTLHGKVSPIPGAQLLLSAQKQGFVLERGALRFRQHGAELFKIEAHNGETLSEDRLKTKAIQNPVVILDIPKAQNPVLAFDELLQQTAKLSQTLSAQLMDDRLRPITDQGFELLRVEISKSAHAMRHIGIEPGSTRALRLFAS